MPVLAHTVSNGPNWEVLIFAGGVLAFSILLMIQKTATTQSVVTLVVVAVIAAVSAFTVFGGRHSHPGTAGPTTTDDVFLAAVVGLCSTSQELESTGDIAAAHQVFLDQAHLALHALADALQVQDRAVAAEVLRAIERTDSRMIELSTKRFTDSRVAEIEADLDELISKASTGLKVLSVTPPACAQ